MIFYEAYYVEDDGHKSGEKFYAKKDNAIKYLKMLREKAKENSYILYVPDGVMEMRFEDEE